MQHYLLSIPENELDDHTGLFQVNMGLRHTILEVSGSPRVVQPDAAHSCTPLLITGHEFWVRWGRRATGVFPSSSGLDDGYAERRSCGRKSPRSTCPRFPAYPNFGRIGGGEVCRLDSAPSSVEDIRHFSTCPRCDFRTTVTGACPAVE